MDSGGVLTAGFGVAQPKRHVHRATHLLVEQNVLCPSRDPVVRPERELAEAARSRVGVERLDQKWLILVRTGIDYETGIEPQPDTRDFTPLCHHRVREMDVPLDRILHRSGEDLAGWKIALSVGVDPRTTTNAEPKIRPWRGDVDLASLLKPIDHAGLPRRELAPGGDRIGPVEHAGRLQEGGELISRHVRVLRVSGGREDGGRPAAFASRGTREGRLS